MFRAAFIGFCVLLLAAVCFSTSVGAGSNNSDRLDGDNIAMRKTLLLPAIFPLECIDSVHVIRKHP